MSVARHHSEWLSLVDISGPFLSLPVLLRVFPQQLDALDSGLGRDVRLAFSEWEDAAGDRAIHTAWVEFVLKRVLQFPGEVLLSGQNLPTGLEVPVPEHGEALRPTYAVKRPEDASPAMLVVTYPPEQRLDAVVAEGRWRTASPATRMMTLLQGAGVGIGLVTNGNDWQLVAARAGETTTYVTWDAALWSEEPLTLRAFCSLLGARRSFGAAEADSLPAMLAESAQNQQDVTDQLGYQVRKAVEVLVQAVDRIDSDRQNQLLEGIGEKELYQAALTVMMRLVFVFSAEERGLLLLGDPLWDRHYAVSTLRDQLREVPDENLLTYRHDAWARLMATFRAIYAGVEHDQMRLPAYGGALFDPDRYPFLEGRALRTSWRNVPALPLPINNRTVLHLLESLQFLEMRLPSGGSEPRRLSFRALDIEQLGHVYEGLLDHTAKRATSTVLGLRGSGGEDVEVELSTLETKSAEGSPVLLDFLKERTGRQLAALKRDISRGEPPNALGLQATCAGHEGLYDRVARFAHLMRDDSNGHPVVIHAGSVYVAKGTDRRNSGTHYTPRSLTEEVVKTTLDPVVYVGVSEGIEPSVDTLRPPADILSLKVCDAACGSGAFLVQACRYLSERVVEGWARAESQSTMSVPLVVPEAIPAGAGHSEQLLPRDPEERLALARRLVAERCLYGVDINPMAVEMAKLSLWLVTLHKHRPFTFLDHAIKCGDSLLGLYDPAQLDCFHLYPSRAQSRVVDYLLTEVRSLLAHARAQRQALERFTALDVRDGELKTRLHRDAEQSLVRVRLLADLIVGAAISTAGSNTERSGALLDARLEDLLLQAADTLAPHKEQRVAAEQQEDSALWQLREAAERLLGAAATTGDSRRPFHWVVEFPEVFSSGASGFDALVGNPPFLGGKKITGLFGTDYRDYLVLHLAEGRRGSADLCAYFFLRATQVVRAGGSFGLLAVNTIAEGDTRQVALEPMLRSGTNLFAARPNFEWPGAAAVLASAVHGTQGAWNGARRLSNVVVPTISAFLSSEDEWSPKPLHANADRCFQGSIVLGMGFIISPEEAHAHIARDARNAAVLFPYLNGEDLNSHPEQRASRWVINFWDWPLERTIDDEYWLGSSERQRNTWMREGRVPKDYPGPVAADYAEVLEVVERLVRPERQRRDAKGNYELRSPLPQRWWHYADKRPALYHAIGRGAPFARHPEGWDETACTTDRVFACSLVSKHLAVGVCRPETVFAHRLAVFSLSDWASFALLSSSLNDAWARKNSSSLESRLNYSPSDAFETLPRFSGDETLLTALGEEYFELRREFCLRNQLGLTDFYNAFHSPERSEPDLKALRQLLASIDRALLDAYGWGDLNPSHGFHEISTLPPNDRTRFTLSEGARIESLRRLASLNRRRWQDEQGSVESSGASFSQSEARPRRQGRTQPKLASAAPQADMFD